MMSVEKADNMVVKNDMQYLVATTANPLTLLSSGQFFADDGWMHAERVIDSYELIIGLRGTLYIEQEGIGYEIRQGDALLLLPYCHHKGIRPSPADTSFFWMHFTGSSIKMVQAEKLEDGKIVFPHGGEQQELAGIIAVPQHCVLGDDAKVNIYCRQMLHLTQSHPYTRSFSDYLLMLLLMELTQQTLFAGGVQPRRNIDKIVAEIAEWIRINSYEEFSVSNMIKKYGLSYDYVERSFRNIMGAHIKEYINRNKIEKAKSLLLQTGMTVQETAWLIGFRDEKYFMKLFKKTQGMTPSQYRSAFYKTHFNKD